MKKAPLVTLLLSVIVIAFSCQKETLPKREKAETVIQLDEKPLYENLKVKNIGSWDDVANRDPWMDFANYVSTLNDNVTLLTSYHSFSFTYELGGSSYSIRNSSMRRVGGGSWLQTSKITTNADKSMTVTMVAEETALLYAGYGQFDDLYKMNEYVIQYWPTSKTAKITSRTVSSSYTPRGKR